MRLCRKNKKKLWYATYREREIAYLKDLDGNIVYEEVDGEEVPVETGYSEPHYEDAVSFMGYIQFQGGESEAKAFGVSMDSYTHILIMRRDEIPIDETSLIFLNEPETVAENAADFKVTKIAESLNFVTYLLRAKDADN